ncbi:MAG: Rz1-like lysis system protein LysC [Pseudomonadota bacterium]|nr:Rz1-like lysis system protein LysC [Pseudomonadota bacterium]
MIGCSATPSQDIPPTVSTCPIVSPCQLSPVTLTNHRDLITALTTTENDWADCAAQIDSIVNCQLRDQNHGQTQQPETTPD